MAEEQSTARTAEIPAGAIVHIAAQDVGVNYQLRQRCAWCAAILIDLDLRRVAVEVPKDGSEPKGPPVWRAGSLVVVDGPLKYEMAQVPSEKDPNGFVIPKQACFNLDHSVTGTTRFDPTKVICARCGCWVEPVDGVVEIETGANGWQHANTARCDINLTTREGA